MAIKHEYRRSSNCKQWFILSVRGLETPFALCGRPLNHIGFLNVDPRITSISSRIWVFRKCVTRSPHSDVELIAKHRDKWFTRPRSGFLEHKSRKTPLYRPKSPRIRSRLRQLRLLNHTLRSDALTRSAIGSGIENWPRMGTEPRPVIDSRRDSIVST
jgi:hypothetical protein